MNFTPVLDELKITDLPVLGTLPSALVGTFLRNGPNPIYPPTPSHWFDGDGMIHAIRIDSGRASYSNRFVKTEGYLKEKAAGKSLYGGLLAGPPSKNPANISVVHHHDKILAAWEGGSPHEISRDSLDTVGLYTFSDQWQWSFTAHPKIDPTSGEMYFFGYDNDPPYLRYGVLDPSGKLIHSIILDIPHPVMMHDFVVTENYAVFFDLPLILSSEGLKYQPELGARIGILPRKGQATEIHWFKIQPCWIYHFLNAYEEGREIIIRGSRYDGWPSSSASLYEWRVNLLTNRVTEQPLDRTASEFPVLHPGFVGRKNRFAYLAKDGDALAGGIIKYDLESDQKVIFNFGPNRAGGESLFVSDPSRSNEDGGWLLSFIHDESSGKSDFIVVDAETMGLLATVSLSRRVPLGLHSNWIPSNLGGN